MDRRMTVTRLQWDECVYRKDKREDMKRVNNISVKGKKQRKN